MTLLAIELAVRSLMCDSSARSRFARRTAARTCRPRFAMSASRRRFAASRAGRRPRRERQNQWSTTNQGDVAQRRITQPQALALPARHADAAGLRWWSRWEAVWVNVTVFDRAAPSLALKTVRALTLEDPALLEAADFYGLRIA